MPQLLVTKTPTANLTWKNTPVKGGDAPLKGGSTVSVKPGTLNLSLKPGTKIKSINLPPRLPGTPVTVVTPTSTPCYTKNLYWTYLLGFGVAGLVAGYAFRRGVG